MTLLVLAHLAHWATTAAFFGPVLVLPLFLYVIALRQRRRDSRLQAPGISERA